VVSELQQVAKLLVGRGARLCAQKWLNLMFSKTKKFIILLLMIWLGLLLAGCSDSTVTPPLTPTRTAVISGTVWSVTNTVVPVPDQTEVPFNYKADKTFIFGVTQEPIGLNWLGNPTKTGVGFDPANLDDYASLLITRQVYETLFEFKPKSTGYQYTPFVVKNVQESPDGLSYTIRMGKGLVFSDGSPLDAEVVKFNFLRWSNPNSVFHKGEFSAYRRYFGGFPGNLDIDNLQVLASNEIKIVLKRPMANFYQVLAMPQFGLVSPKSFDANNNFIPSKPIGSGPYKIETQERGENKFVVLKSNYPNYSYQRAPENILPVNLDTIVVKVLKDKAEPLKEIREGRISAANIVKLEEVALETNKNDPNFEIKLRSPLNLAFLSFNMSRPPFNLPEVRQAFAYAINTREIIKNHYHGLGVPASSFLPPNLFSARNDLTPYPYDPDKAKQLLAQVNYTALQTIPLELWVQPGPRLYYPDPNKIADAIIADLAKVGAPVVKKASDTWINFLQNKAEGRYNFYMNGWQGESGDPDEFMSRFWRDLTKETGYDNAVLRDAVQIGGQEIDPVKRRPFYTDAQGIIYNDFLVIPVAYVQSPVAVRRDVTGFDTHPTGIEVFGSLNFTGK
jgi:peptide/nickel transport system substrate-binding protein